MSLIDKTADDSVLQESTILQTVLITVTRASCLVFFCYFYVCTLCLWREIFF